MKNKVVKNTAMLYMMNIAKMIFPLLTLPYLTRILSLESYGVVTYVKAIMQYLQLFVDFGFLLSGTKGIIDTINDKEKLNYNFSKILFSKIFLAIVGFIFTCVFIFCIPVLNGYELFTIFSYFVVAMTCFLFDYYFRGIEEMQVITIRFIVMKGIAALLTFIFVKTDADILWIPILDIIGSIIAILLVYYEIKKRNIKIVLVKTKDVFFALKDSFVFFISNIATTAFLAMNTILIGIFLSENDIAYWSVCLQMVSAVLSLYSPLTDGIYPHMLKTKDLNIIRKSLKIYMPMIVVGCLFTFFVSKYALLIIAGEKYIAAENVLRALIPVMLFGFPSALFGWPVLGAISKEKSNTKATVSVALIQVLGLIILLFFNKFSLINIALYRGFTEMLLFIIRFNT